MMGARITDDIPLQIAIGTTPSFSGGRGARQQLSLDAEIKLLKPALLYGDGVTLYSPSANLVGMVADLAQITTSEKLILLRQLAPILGAEGQAFLDGMERYERLKRRKGKSKDELLALIGFEREFPRALDRLWSDLLLPQVATMLEDSGANQLAAAIDANLLRIERLVTNDGGFSSDKIIEVFVAKLAEVLSGSAYPLFDEAVGKLVRQGVNEGLFRPTPPSLARGKQVSAAAQFMGYLPTFERASVAEVLDIRDELREPLVRFRAAMIELGRMVESAAHDEGFQEQLEQLYREQVAPALQEIDERVQSNAYLRNLVGELVPELKTIVGSVLAVGTIAAADFPVVIAGAAGAPATRSVIAAAVTAIHEREREAQTISQHKLYFLYRIQQLLER